MMSRSWTSARTGGVAEGGGLRGVLLVVFGVARRFAVMYGSKQEEPRLALRDRLSRQTG